MLTCTISRCTIFHPQETHFSKWSVCIVCKVRTVFIMHSVLVIRIMSVTLQMFSVHKSRRQCQHLILFLQINQERTKEGCHPVGVPQILNKPNSHMRTKQVYFSLCTHYNKQQAQSRNAQPIFNTPKAFVILRST